MDTNETTPKAKHRKRTDLMMAVSSFMWTMWTAVRHQKDGKWLSSPDGSEPTIDNVLETQLEILNLHIRRWWCEYKDDWQNFTP